MRLATCEYLDREHVAIVLGDQLGLLPPGTDIIDVATSRASVEPISVVPATSVSFLPPVPRPAKILCVGVNYRDHAAEAQGAGVAPAGDHPSLFIRFVDSFVGHGHPVVIPDNSRQFDFEGELAVIIGKPAYRISPDTALEHVAGYAVLADNSLRDFQFHAKQVTAGKNFLRSGAIGPYLTTRDEVPDLSALELTTRLNNVVMQHASLGDMIFDVPTILSYITQFTQLSPGDIIATGTPAGIGLTRDPPMWMKAGDTLEIDIPGVGCLRNSVAAETVGRS